MESFATHLKVRSFSLSPSFTVKPRRLNFVNVLRPQSVSEHAHISSGHTWTPVNYDNKLTVLQVQMVKFTGKLTFVNMFHL